MIWIGLFFKSFEETANARGIQREVVGSAYNRHIIPLYKSPIMWLSHLTMNPMKTIERMDRISVCNSDQTPNIIRTRDT